MTTQANCITIKGSAKTVAQYLNYGINSILFQRGIYPQTEFKFQDEYGIQLLVTKNARVQDFLNKVLKTVEEWLPQEKLERISMVLFDIPTRKVIERWDFSIKHEDDYTCNENSEPISHKDVKVVQSEIRNVMRQIISSISFLPAIDNPTTFDVYLHPKEVACKKGVPELWEWKSTCDIDIPNSQAVKLRSFSTGFDLVETEVVYKIVESGKKE